MLETCLKPPYAFAGPYASCYVNPRVAMDARHVYMVHGILSAWRFNNALELGSFWGASSTAFVEAINGGSKMVATFCDPVLTPGLRDVVASCKHPSQVRITKDKSWEVLEADEDFDFIMVDANHDAKSVQLEIDRLLIRRPLCVMAHDTNATAAGYPHAEGAKLLKHTFQAEDGYACIEDCRERDGEETQRGLFCATRDSRVFAIAEQVFHEWF